MKNFFVEKVEASRVIPNRRPMARRMLSAYFGNDGRLGANLVELSDSFSTVDAHLLHENISVTEDLDLIYSLELDGMLGSPEKLASRLSRFFDTRINSDDSKESLFKGIRPPPPKSKP